MSTTNDRDDYITLDDWVVAMIESKRTSDPEFQALLKIHGREKFERIWKEYREARKANLAEGANG